MIDFRKAYDSINRCKLIEVVQVLGKYHANTKIIDMLVQMYSHDVTTISLGNLQDKIEVTSDSRLGCIISTLLFKMVTF